MSVFNGVCEDCRAEIWHWLDYGKPLHLNKNFASIGDGKHAVPSWDKTLEILQTQTKLIQKNCLENHTER